MFSHTVLGCHVLIKRFCQTLSHVGELTDFRSNRVEGGRRQGTDQ